MDSPFGKKPEAERRTFRQASGINIRITSDEIRFEVMEDAPDLDDAKFEAGMQANEIGNGEHDPLSVYFATNDAWAE